MGELRDKMERDMLLKNLSDRTRKTYLACVRDFVRFHRRDPRELGDEEIKAFLHHLIVEKKALQWISGRKGFFVPVRVVSALYRGKFLYYLKQAVAAGDLVGLPFSVDLSQI